MYIEPITWRVDLKHAVLTDGCRLTLRGKRASVYTPCQTPAPARVCRTTLRQVTGESQGTSGHFNFCCHSTDTSQILRRKCILSSAVKRCGNPAWQQQRLRTCSLRTSRLCVPTGLEQTPLPRGPWMAPGQCCWTMVARGCDCSVSYHGGNSHPQTGHFL